VCGNHQCGLLGIKTNARRPLLQGITGAGTQGYFAPLYLLIRTNVHLRSSPPENNFWNFLRHRCDALCGIGAVNHWTRTFVIGWVSFGANVAPTAEGFASTFAAASPDFRLAA